MKKIFLFFAFYCGIFCHLEGADYAPLTSQEESAYYQKLDQTVANAEKNVKQLQANATRKDVMPTWNSKLELQNAIIQLEVKKTLVNNFKQTESLRSSRVRDLLLQVLNKQTITTSDLAELQNLVINEKARIHEANMQQQPSVPKT